MLSRGTFVHCADECRCESRGEVKFFQIREDPNTFELARYELDDEDMAYEPRRALSVSEGFQDISQDGDIHG